MQHYGLFGGTFNPIHRGHLHAADELRKTFPLDRIYLIPSALPPHKRTDNLAAAADRLEMIRLAVARRDYLRVSEVELSRTGPSYTIDTVRYYKTRANDEARWYLVMGLDAFLEIDTWKSYRELMEKIPFIVLSRPDKHEQTLRRDIEAIDNYLSESLEEVYVFSPVKSCFYHTTRPPVHLIDIRPLDISSTEIRARIKAGKPIESLVPEAVNHFIKAKGLYA